MRCGPKPCAVRLETALRNQIVSDQLLVRTTTVPASRSCNSLLDAMINKIKFREQPAGMIKYVTAWSVNLPAKAAGFSLGRHHK